LPTGTKAESFLFPKILQWCAAKFPPAINRTVRLTVSLIPHDVIATPAARGFDTDDLFGRLLGRYSQLAANAFLPPSSTHLLPLPALLNAAFPEALTRFVQNHVTPRMLNVRAIRRAIANPLLAPDGRVFMAHVTKPLPDNLIARAWRQAWSDPELLSAASADLDLNACDASAAIAVLAGLLDIPVPVLCHSLDLLTLVINQEAQGALSPDFLVKFLHQFADKANVPAIADLSILAAILRSSHPVPEWLPPFLISRPRHSFPLLNDWQGALATIAG